MVTVHCRTTDTITAWRVRDALACHPLLGGATADIAIEATHAHVTIHGWIAKQELTMVVNRLARQSAGRRTVEVEVGAGRVDAHRSPRGHRARTLDGTPD